jgi:hypothetical protein
MFIRHIFLPTLALSFYKVIPVERELRRGTGSLKIQNLDSAVRFPASKPFALKILPLTSLDGRF